MGVHLMRQGDFITDYEVKLGGKIAEVLCGGNVTPGTPVSEQYILDLEREGFKSLCGERKTQERIQFTLEDRKNIEELSSYDSLWREDSDRFARLFLVVWIAFLAGAQKDAPSARICTRCTRCDRVTRGLQPVLFVRASGSKSTPARPTQPASYSWTLKAPEAELKDRKDKVVGQHSAGPTWKLKDGSEVTGKEPRTLIRSIRTPFPGC